MSEIINFYYSRCDGIMFDQVTGRASYVPEYFNPVGQLIGPQAITEFCPSFSIEIIDSGAKNFIGIGLCHKNYSRCNQPGWYENSIGYHADDGGIYDNWGMPMQTFGRVARGEVMECSFDFETKTVTFLRNGEPVFTTRALNIPEDGFYPIVGLHSQGEEIRLREMEPWSLDPHVMSFSKEVVYHTLDPRGATVSQASGIVRYTKRTSQPEIGQLISKCPLTPDINSFSVEIANIGEKSSISIGLCHRLFPNKCQPGWLKNTIAYHVGDKAVYNGSNDPHPCGSKVKVGDILTCEIDFANMTCVFKRNGGAIYRGPSMKQTDGGYHAVLGFSQSDDAVCLLEKKPWRLKNDMVSNPIPKQIYHFSSCDGVTLDQNKGLLTLKPGESTGQLISKCHLSSEVNKFSIEIKTGGIEGSILIGLCPAPSQGAAQRSGTGCTIAYLAGSGKICYVDMEPVSVAKSSEGDVISCEYKITEKKVIFRKNKEMIHESTIPTVPSEGLFAAVGLGSMFESVRLCQKEPWRKEDVSMDMPTEEPRTMPKCCICMDNGVTRFLIPCGHTFCVDCTQEWTQQHRTCPACRTSYQEIKMLYY